MPRIIEITVPPQATTKLIADINKFDFVFSLRVYKGASVNPAGDVLSVTLATSGLQHMMRFLDKTGLGNVKDLSISSSEPDSLISPKYRDQIDRDGIVASWEEMEMVISKSSNINSMVLLLVASSGVIAALGIATNAIHVVIGGMLVAPGFMPIMRIPLGLVAQNTAVWRRGVTDFLLAYLVLIVAAGLTAYILKVSGSDPLPGKQDYYAVVKSLFSYWTTITAASVAVSVAAAIAGAVMVAMKRSIFTSGVMIGLALVPSAALIGMSLATGDVTAAGHAALRWVTDVGIVLVVALLVFLLLKSTLIKRNIAM